MRLPLLLLTLASLALAEPGVDALYRGFQNPPASYSVSPYWFWNGRVSPAETRRQLQAMAAHGVHAATVMNWAGLEPGYLTEEWWKQVGVALDEAKAAGVTLNFSDEYLWPSGQVWDYSSLKPEPSRVLQLHPEFAMRKLVASSEPANAEFCVAYRANADGSIDEKSLQLAGAAWQPPDAQWKRVYYSLQTVVERNQRVDLMNPAAVRVFIDQVYEQYARRFPQHLGTTIKLFVADHEGAYGAPVAYTPALFDTFKARHGYDLRPVLPLLDKETPRAVEVRRDYFETVSNLYSMSFVQQVTDWCTRHKVLHGHSDIEETLRLQVIWTPDMWRLWRSSSAIYIDALVERARMPIDFMEARSVAHFEGRPLVVENQGLTGNDSFWSLEKARLGSNMALLWGSNLLIPHYFEYDPKHIQYPPSWFLTQPQFDYFQHYADMVRRVQFMNAQGVHRARVAIYYPLESAYANAGALLSGKGRDFMRWNNFGDTTQDYYTALQLELARHGWEYHILDAHYLERAKLEGKTLALGGERFEALILPPMSVLDRKSAQKISEFRAAGGLVLETPRTSHDHFTQRLNYTERALTPDDYKREIQPLLDRLPRPDVITEAPVYTSHRSVDGVDWFWVVNDSGEPRDVALTLPRAGTVEKWDAETGKRTRLSASNGRVSVSMGAFDAFFLVLHSGASSAPPEPGRERRLLTEIPSSGWTFTPESPVKVPYAGAYWLAPERNAQRGWWLSGPYPYGDHEGFFKEFETKDWQWVESATEAVRPPKQDVWYAKVNVWSPKAQRARAAVTAFDSAKFWWNGELKLQFHSHAPFVNIRDAWAHRPEIDVKQGWNTVLLKVGKAQAGAMGFMFRITDEQGNTLRDLVYAKDQVLPEATAKSVTLRIPAPPGTAGPDWTYAGDETSIPERAIEFQPKPQALSLFCWSETGLANYSGAASYERTFRLEALPKGRILLDLGRVGLAAEVWVNGRKAGERAWRPFELDVTEFLKAGENRLKIRVANSNAGWSAQGPEVYERGGWGTHFNPERERVKSLHPNGLEGPVRLLWSGGE
jgi:hypothetical protein